MLSLRLRVGFVALAAVVVGSLLAGCDLTLPGGHDDLTFEQRPYLGDELRMDGYYYYRYHTSEGDRYRTHFFYRNGVVRYVGTFENLDSLTGDDFLDGTARHHWGLFHVDGERIAFERWYPAEYVKAFIRSGRILNDTTFVITESRRSNGEAIRERNEVYHFRPFSPKPDSTSGFLE
jgi:hypothetical protein